MAPTEEELSSPPNLSPAELKQKKQEMKEEEVAKQLKDILASTKIKHYSNEQLDQMIEESEYIKQWKAIPKARRERLTRKQMIAMGRETTMAEAIEVQVAHEKKSKKKWTI